MAADFDALKEKAIGMEVFGRPPGYDTSADAIVRVTASDVRKRLSQHYGRPGTAAEYRISLPAGSYVPQFAREPTRHPEKELLSTVSLRIQGNSSRAGSVAPPGSRRQVDLVRFMLAAVLISALSLAAFLVAWNHMHRPESLSALPWKDAREQYLASFELSYAQAVLARCGGNLSAAAREAGVDRKTFYALLRREKEQQAGESIPQMEPEIGE